MTIHNLYIFDRHCQCIYFQKWTHSKSSNNATTTSSSNNGTSNNNSQLGNSNSRLGGLATSSSRFSTSSTASSVVDQNSPNANSLIRSEDNHQTGITQQSGLAAGSVISIEEEAKLVYGVVLSLRNFVRKLSGNQDGFISYKTSTYRLHYYETPTGLKFVMNSDPNTESLRMVLKQIHVQLYVEFVVKNGLMRFDDTRWEISHGFLQSSVENDANNTHNTNTTTTATTHSSAIPSPPGNISNELFRVAVDRFIRSLKSF
ncbi:Sybindin-like family-domain-containing protein, partial [Pilaira anomala]